MNTWTKRGTIIMLAALIIVVGVVVPFRNSKAAILYHNTASATVSTTINSNGKLQTTLNVVGINGVTTQIETELYVEKSILGIFWERVDIGYTNDLWLDSTTSYLYSNTFTTNLSSSGTYRVSVKFIVSGTGGSTDIITKTNTVTY